MVILIFELVLDNDEWALRIILSFFSNDSRGSVVAFDRVQFP